MAIRQHSRPGSSSLGDRSSPLPTARPSRAAVARSPPPVPAATRTSRPDARLSVRASGGPPRTAPDRVPGCSGVRGIPTVRARRATSSCSPGRDGPIPCRYVGIDHDPRRSTVGSTAPRCPITAAVSVEASVPAPVDSCTARSGGTSVGGTSADGAGSAAAVRAGIGVRGSRRSGRGVGAIRSSTTTARASVGLSRTRPGGPLCWAGGRTSVASPSISALVPRSVPVSVSTVMVIVIPCLRPDPGSTDSEALHAMRVVRPVDHVSRCRSGECWHAVDSEVTRHS